MRYLVGVDGGGTKTEAILCDLTGAVLAHVLGGPASAVGISFKKAIENIHAVLACLLKDADGLNTEIAAAYFGISGCGDAFYHRIFQSALKGMLPHAEILLASSDAMNPLTAENGMADGIVAICGTGSGAYVRLNGTIQHRVDGNGYLLGDDAGGFAMGRAAINAALRDEDGRGPHTLLTEICCQKAGTAMRDAIGLIERGGKATVASYAPCLFEAWQRGDVVAAERIEHFAFLMAEIIAAAGRKMASRVKTVVLCGSLLRSELGFIEKVKAFLKDSYEYRLIIPSTAPVFGAAAYAYHLASGTDASPKFKAQFLKTTEKGAIVYV